MIFVRKGKYRGAYDFEGNHIVPDKYAAISCHFDYIEVESYLHMLGAYDYKGNQILPISTTYRYINYIGNLILQGTGNGTRVFDKTGKEVEPGIVYEDVFMQHDEFLAVKLEGQWKILYSV